MDLKSAFDSHKWLKLEKIGDARFQGQCDSNYPQARTFGGQVLAQALASAYLTVTDGFALNSFHSYFIRVGEEKVAIHYNVSRVRDGRNFSSRTVVAVQHGKVIFTSEFSFQRASGASHFKVTPSFPADIPPPETLRTSVMLKRQFIDAALRSREMAALVRGKRADRTEPPFELRPVDGTHYTLGIPVDELQARWLENVVVENEVEEVRKKGRTILRKPLKQYVWIKYKQTTDVTNRPLAHCILASLSDLTLFNTALLVFGAPQAFRFIASLDHSLWIHEFDFDINEWMLYEQMCEAHADHRSLVRARIWSQSGRLLASTAQEVLVYPDDRPLVNEEGEADAVALDGFRDYMRQLFDENNSDVDLAEATRNRSKI